MSDERRRCRSSTPTSGSAESFGSVGRSSRLTLPERIAIADGPLRTSTPGRWRLFLTATPPPASWRAALLQRAALASAAQKLQLSFDQSALLFSCEDSEHALLDALREINHLIEETNRLSSGRSRI
jgi:hypothetical protein